MQVEQSHPSAVRLQVRVPLASGHWRWEWVSPAAAVMNPSQGLSEWMWRLRTNRPWRLRTGVWARISPSTKWPQPCSTMAMTAGSRTHQSADFVAFSRRPLSLASWPGRKLRRTLAPQPHLQVFTSRAVVCPVVIPYFNTVTCTLSSSQYFRHEKTPRAPLAGGIGPGGLVRYGSPILPDRVGWR